MRTPFCAYTEELEAAEAEEAEGPGAGEAVRRCDIAEEMSEERRGFLRGYGLSRFYLSRLIFGQYSAEYSYNVESLGLSEARFTA
jgi:hypothetical protein